MTERIADALVLAFTPGMSLREWESLGLLVREWALYERLQPYYGRILLLTYGTDDDRPILARLGDGVDLVCNSERLESARYLASIPARVSELLAPCATVVVKTNQLPAGPMAVRVAAALRQQRPAGSVSIVARGGYLASRFVAYEKGAASPEARRAGEEEKALCSAADVVIGTTPKMLDDLAWRWSLQSEALHLVPNYVLTDHPPSPGEERDPGLVLYCGQLTARKRVDIIIEAIAALPDPMRHSVTLRVFGQGPEEARLKALAADRLIRCEFRGRIPHRDLLEQMSRCAIYAQASELEGHPKTVLEAMSTGATVLVADSPGLGGVVQNGATGLRVPGNVECFSQSLAALLSDPEWRALLGSAAARSARAAFGVDHVASLEVNAHREAARRAARAGEAHGKLTNPAEVRWEPDLLNATPTVAADRWMHSLEAFARRLSDSGRAELISRLEASLRGRGSQSAA